MNSVISFFRAHPRSGSLIVGLITVYALLIFSRMGITASDEYLYLYDGWLWSQGNLPYRDFFLARPPIAILIPAVITLFFGPSITLFHFLPLLISLGSGVLVFLLGLEIDDSQSDQSMYFASIASLLFLYSFVNIASGSHYTGHELATFALLAGTLSVLRKRYILAGVILALGSGVGVTCIIGFIALLCFLLLTERKKAGKFVGAFLVLAGIIHGTFSLLVGRPFWDQAYFYHFLKPAVFTAVTKRSEILFGALEMHAVLIILSVIGMIFLARVIHKRGMMQFMKSHPLYAIGIVVMLFESVFLAFSSQIFPHYLIVLAPFMAILASHAVMSFWEAGRNGMSQFFIRLTVCSVLIFSLLDAGVRSHHEYRNRHFIHARESARILAQDLGPDETIYGDFGVVPAFSILSGRRIAANEADSSIQRIDAALTTFAEIIERIESDNIGAILTREHLSLSAYIPFRNYLQEHYVLQGIFMQKPSYVRVEYWRPKSKLTPPQS